jgi:hypothetical protein
MSLKAKIDAIELNQAIEQTSQACLKVVENHKKDSIAPDYYQGFEEGYKDAIRMMQSIILELQQR